MDHECSNDPGNNFIDKDMMYVAFFATFVLQNVLINFVFFSDLTLNWKILVLMSSSPRC